MFTVKECTKSEYACESCDGYGAGCALCRKLGAPAEDGDRIFVLCEGGAKAIGLLGLKRGKVIIKGVYGDVDCAYRDVINRSLMHVCRCMNPITVRVESTDEYWRGFGFIESGGGMEIKNTEIKFGHLKI